MARGARISRARALPVIIYPDPDNPALAWREIAGQLLFLDLAADRYFRLSREQNHAFLDMLDQTGRNRWHQPRGFPLPARWRAPEDASAAIDEGDFSLSEVARSLWLQRRVERRLGLAGFQSVLAHTHALLEARCRQGSKDGGPDRVIRAFEHARILRTAANRCLPRSIALGLRLAALGTPVTVVIGVKLAPFGAHCWVQHGTLVVSDRVGEVQPYTPLLVL